MRNVYGRLGRRCRSIRMLCRLWLLTDFYAWLLFWSLRLCVNIALALVLLI